MKNDTKIKPGKEYWRSLNQLADTPEFKDFLHREFPEGASELSDGMSRRKFLTLMGASMALAGLVSCRRPVEKILPYVKAPEEIIPGVPRYYATTMPFGQNSYGMVVETHEGRPTKIEGNEKHPSSLGGSNAWMQAAILGLYDPDRSQLPIENGSESSWDNFVKYWQGLYTEYTANQGKGLAVLSESAASPTLFRLQREFLSTFPQAKWYVYEPVGDENIRSGIAAAAKQDNLVPMYSYDKARVILSLESDFITTESENIVNARGFIDGRRVSSVKDEMNRLYVIESAFTLTGGMADHRKKLPAHHVFAFAVTLIKELQKEGILVAGLDNSEIPADFSFDNKWIATLARDLAANQGQSLVIAGRHQPAQVHAIVFAINDALANTGKTVSYRKAKYELFDHSADISNLTAGINEGMVESLIMLGTNPVYHAPADLGFSGALKKLKHTIHLGLLTDETAQKCEWHLPQAHFLESWGDAQAFDGTLSIIQPMIAPLFDGHSNIEMVNFLTTAREVSGYELVRPTWESVLGKSGFEKKWRRILHDGVLENSQLPQIKPVASSNSLTAYLSENPVMTKKVSRENMEVIFKPSPAVFDGRFANNGWLQELPDGVSKLAWDNAVLMSHTTAGVLGVKNEDLVILNLNGRETPMPVWILPGYADYSLTLTLGYGRTSAGRIGTGVGFNAYRIRSANHPDMAYGLAIRKTIDTYPMANTQDHSSMEGRPLIRESSITKYRENPDFAQKMVEHPPLISLWDEHSYEEGNQWGMTIDLNACTGCNTCTIACQSENNIPIIGKEQVKNGREMHWLRLDRYFSGDVDDPEMVYQPVGCQHCENAPCEQVCPVAATVHDSEGLNVMTYNRCIGTRYCSNNCPYKVRRFNFFNYTNELPEIMQMAQNPDVTVRSRGVMEKCTYCLQRISAAKINAKKENETLQDGDVIAACQQACPTNAIEFGNINDPQSRVSKSKKNERRYEMLAELNIRPRTSYLAKLRNPNPDLVDG